MVTKFENRDQYKETKICCLMENYERTEFHDILASRKAEDAAWRRFHAAEWLESFVGPLGFSSHPSEKEFVSRLRNGLILCNAINKVHPGAVPKVVENQAPLQSLNRESHSQPLPAAYQYFENVKNFLMAVEELKLPAFEASDLERDILEAGSVAKVVDCVLALKSYHECKQMNGGNGFYRPTRSPIVFPPSNGNNSRPISSESCRRLDMSAATEKNPPADVDIQKLADEVVKLLAGHVDDTKENINGNLRMSFHDANTDLEKLLTKIMSTCLEDKLQNPFSEKQLKVMFKDLIKERSISPDHSASVPFDDSAEPGGSKCGRACSSKGNCKHRHLFQLQEKELMDLKSLLMKTKIEFEDLQSHFQADLKNLGFQVQEMSTAALGYHRVLKENRNLYNMVQDLKGNIRVYCRIRPATAGERNSVVDFVGEDGSLVILDPLKPRKEGKKMFQFNRVFGPSSTQDDVYKDTQPLIRSVMDGYNVCIFAYGQTGSGKTYTMSGPSGGSTKDMGINFLALNDLFQMSKKRKDIISYDINVQMVEIYNEQVRDLLVEDPSATKLEIRSCSAENGLSLPDAKMYPVNSTSDVLNLMKLGEVNRVVSSTALNNRSSRSHSILTVHVHGKDTSGNTIRSCLHLVDLAGSERVDKSEVTGDRLKEALHINKSLSCLGDVIAALAQRNSHVPYRNSKLTLLLQDSLGGHAKTLMFAHMSPEGDSFGETISTLKFAQRVSTVELGAARANKESSEIMQLKEQVETLKKALATSKEEQNTQFNRMKEPRSPSKAMMERTPPRLRRLSIENGSEMKSKTVNPLDRKGLKTPSVPARSRRLSLEGPKYGKKDTSKIATDDTSKHLFYEPVITLQKYGQSQDQEAAASKTYGYSSNGRSTMEVYRLNAPRSPTSSSYQKQMAKTDTSSQIPLLKLPVTPEPQIQVRNEVQIVKQNDFGLPTDFQATNLTSSAHGKESQIRKSLRTIGKLINGSEKRNQQHSKEVEPMNCASNKNSDSPLTANGRTIRRQSLTGVYELGSDRSRRSSLGGKAMDSDDSRRNARTPPPVHYSSSKTTKRWH
ncbi:kinesin-like protein KIN-14L [Mercurialis annua]|uniref:kinesin-like protein KIN-14L n=1 Tax=Mercurialis annua TaxID=3986 RepID=UPI002160CF0B|nr:kinesin-like protein KIN-14L [Mercurialis annua]